MSSITRKALQFSKTFVSVVPIVLVPFLTFCLQHLGGQHLFMVSSYRHRFTETLTSFCLVLKGSVLVGSETIPHEAFHTLVLSHEEGETGVQLAAGQDGTEFVVVRHTLDTFVTSMFNGTIII